MVKLLNSDSWLASVGNTSAIPLL